MRRRSITGATRRTRRLPRSRQLSEFSRVNAILGTEPIRPDLCGPRVRQPPSAVAQHVSRVLSSPGYCWRPSREYLRRRAEILYANGRIPRRRGSRPLPPILSYVEVMDVVPNRLQPMLHRTAQVEDVPPLPDLPRDLRDLERIESARTAPIIHPLVAETDPEYLRSHRTLLPRRYRRFLLHSPYSRLAACVLLGVALLGALWVTWQGWTYGLTLSIPQPPAARALNHGRLPEFGAFSAGHTRPRHWTRREGIAYAAFIRAPRRPPL